MISQTTSKAITAIRFPMIVAVVMLHTYLTDKSWGSGQVWIETGQYPVFDIFRHFVQSDLANVSVSLFFAISGFLFFQGQTFSLDVYKQKMKRRIRSLLIPFLLWNTLYMFYIAVLGIIHPAFITYKVSLFNMSLPQFLNAYWDLNNGLIPLWFIRDLMIINICAPLIYILIKKFGTLLPIILLLLWIAQLYIWIPGIGIRCSAFYVLGAYAGINSKKTERFLDRYSMAAIILSLILFVIETIMWCGGLYDVYFTQLCLAIGVIGVFCFMRKLVQKGIHASKLLSEASFFIFLFHMFILKGFLLLCYRFVPASTVSGILALLAIPLLCSAACCLVYIVLRRILPRSTKILMGAR